MGPHLDPRLAAAAALVRPGSIAADIGCDHGKLTAFLALRGDVKRVIGADLRPGPLAVAQSTCQNAGCQDRVELRLGDGLTVLSQGEATDIVLAGISAQTTIQILQQASWVRDPAVRLIMVPATKHPLLRQWLLRQGFTLVEDMPVQAAGRWYAVMAAEYTATPIEPTGWQCVCGLTQGKAGAQEYLKQQLEKLRKYRRGLSSGQEQRELDALLECLAALIEQEESLWQR